MIGLHSGSHTVNQHDSNIPIKEKIVVPIDTLDNIAREQNIKIIDFIKIDVEGWELEVLKGATNIMKKTKFFSIAAYHNEEDNLLIAEFLRKHNFKFINDRKEIYAWNKNFKN